MRYDPVKRCIDVSVALLLLLLFSPVLVAGAVLVALSLGRPVLFRQRRPGRGERPFTVLKFRTMRAGAGADAERLTRVGRLLRASSVDELPALWNVVCGQMSLVGPRPLLMEYLPRYTPEQRRRHEVRPGITGLAQVRGRNSLSWPARFALDVAYVEQRGLLLDLRILALTVLVVLRRGGISASGHATMPEFDTSTVDSSGRSVPA